MIDKIKNTSANNVHIAGRGSVVRQLRILASQFRVLRTGTLSEIRPDNMYQPLGTILKNTKIMNKIVLLFFTIVIMISCLSLKNKTTEFQMKDYYFPFREFIEPTTYCFTNANDTTEKSYWEMSTKITGKDTLLFTDIYNSEHQITEKLVEKITKTGSKMYKYTLFMNEENYQKSATCHVIDSVIFNWNITFGQSMNWKVEFPDFASNEAIEFAKQRTFFKIDSSNLLATFIDKNSMRIKSSIYSNNYTVENYYKKGVGIINYKITMESGLVKNFKLTKRIKNST